MLNLRQIRLRKGSKYTGGLVPRANRANKVRAPPPRLKIRKNPPLINLLKKGAIFHSDI